MCTSPSHSTGVLDRWRPHTLSEGDSKDKVLIHFPPSLHSQVTSFPSVSWSLLRTSLVKRLLECPVSPFTRLTSGRGVGLSRWLVGKSVNWRNSESRGIIVWTSRKERSNRQVRVSGKFGKSFSGPGTDPRPLRIREGRSSNVSPLYPNTCPFLLRLYTWSLTYFEEVGRVSLFPQSLWKDLPQYPVLT